MGLGAVRQDGEVGSVLWIKSGESTFWEQTLTCYHRKGHTSIKLTFALSKAFDMALFVLHWGNGLPRWFTSKESTYQCRTCRRHSFSLWVGKIPGRGHGYLLLYSCLKNYTDRGAWWVTVHRIAKNQTHLKQLNTHIKLKTSSKPREKTFKNNNNNKKPPERDRILTDHVSNKELM